MKAAVFYMSEKPLTASHKPFELNSGRIVYIRGYERRQDAIRALDQAEPLEGETVLNSVELTEEP